MHHVVIGAGPAGVVAAEQQSTSKNTILRDRSRC